MSKFEYFYAQEIENYLYLQVPISLIKEERFKKLSAESKLLYSLLLNRTSLSIKNNWRDEQGRVYIIYTIEEIMEDLNCYQGKASKTMKELKEIGLVKTVRQGLTKPNLIYVMNFSTDLKYKKPVEKPDKTLKCENSNSANAGFANEDMPESQTINIDRIKNDFIKTEISINRSEAETFNEEINDNDMIDTNENKNFVNQSPNNISDMLAEILNSENIAETVANKVDINELRAQYPEKSEEINLLHEINCEVMQNSHANDKIRVSKGFLPLREVREQFALLEKRHYEYVLSSLEHNDNRYKIKGNVKNYCRTALFNAPRTIGYYYDKSFTKSQPQKEKSADDLFEKMLRKSMNF
ncbi:MAG: replication initiator protein A [Clostridiales bacterium]|jgi:hypothetical protein|nr:replication initiator protein A [Clostridiales bacterium]